MSADHLFARPSFLEGVARIVDVGGTLSVYNSSSSAEEADARALQSDWEAVGGDLRRAIRRLKARLKRRLLDVQAQAARQAAERETAASPPG